MLCMSKEVPLYLDDGTGPKFILGTRGATGLELTVGSDIFEESGRSLVRGTLDYLQDAWSEAYRASLALLTGTTLTIVGEV
ncbi:hypothetical protein SOVF_212100 isoform B [Spinacia oleracea]|nr:hypothetical protein SOVF_212100 isoform B [Spinacia oleracea]